MYPLLPFLWFLHTYKIDYILNRICKSNVSENKFYLNKGLNTLHNIKTEEGGKTKKPVYFTRHWAAVASKLQALQLSD